MKTPVLIIGSGLAGLVTAFRLAKAGVDCTLVTKSAEVQEGTNSSYAQGGIVGRPEQDNPNLLTQDILAAGDGINALQAVDFLTREGIDLMEELFLKDIKVPFDRQGEELSFTQEAAHQLPRILHVKDHTGKALMQALWAAVERLPQVTVLRRHVLVDVLTSGHNCRGYQMKYAPNRCLGAYLLNLETGEVLTSLADHTVLCTGGIGQVYEYHTNAEHAYGSGLAVANRARVRIVNARFVQFHPTALWTPQQGRRFLISEALRGEGARLMNREGTLLMDSYPQADLESRAVVSRVIMEELERSQEEFVYLNLADHFKGTGSPADRFPSIAAQCLQEGIDIARDPIPVVPAEHFFCGGIVVDLQGRSELPGLYAAGEVACTGVHGANRLASTSLLECVAWGSAVAGGIAEQVHQADKDLRHWTDQAFDLVGDWEVFGQEKADEAEIELQKDQIRSLMWHSVGIIRTKERLFRAREELRRLWKVIDEQYASYALSESLIELRHMVETAYLIANSASSHTSLKEDSLGGHVLV